MINSNNFDMPDEYEVHVRHHQTNGDPPNNDDHDSNEQQQHHYNDSVLVHVGMDREEEHDVDVDVDEEVVPLTSSSSSSPASSIMDANHNNNINNNMYEKRGLRRVVSMNSTINCNKSRVLLLVAISFAWISSMWHHDRSPEIETISSSSYNQRHTSDYFPPRMVIIGLGDNEESSSLGLYDTNHTISSSYQEIPSYYTKESIVNKNATLITTAATVDWRHQDEVARAHTIAKQGDACGLEPTYARPTCNFMHETSLQPQFPFMKLGNGQKRIAYKLELEMMVGSLVGDSDSDLHINNSNNTETMTSTSTVVGVAFKSSSTKTKTSPDTQKLNRMDAMTAERLTFSNNVVNIYSYCGESTLLELAANDFSHHVPHVSGILSPQTILEYARDAAIALGDLHSISYPNFPAGIMIHRDIRPWNFLVSKESNQLQLHDFNAGRFVPWHNSEEDDHENEDGNDITNSSSTASATTATTNTNNTTPKRLCHWQHKPVKCNSVSTVLVSSTIKTFFGFFETTASSYDCTYGSVPRSETHHPCIPLCSASFLSTNTTYIHTHIRMLTEPLSRRMQQRVLLDRQDRCVQPRQLFLLFIDQRQVTLFGHDHEGEEGKKISFQGAEY
jgi:hypothetical protein